MTRSIASDLDQSSCHNHRARILHIISTLGAIKQLARSTNSTGSSEGNPEIANRSPENPEARKDYKPEHACSGEQKSDSPQKPLPQWTRYNGRRHTRRLCKTLGHNQLTELEADLPELHSCCCLAGFCRHAPGKITCNTHRQPSKEIEDPCKRIELPWASKLIISEITGYSTLAR